MYKYRINGLIAESCFKLYNLPETNGEADIFIRRMEKAKSVAEASNQVNGVMTIPGGVWCLLNDAQIQVFDGKIIELFPYDGLTENDISMYICGWGMALLMEQRGSTAYHCSAIENKNGKDCFIITGVSGAGKSSTALRFMDDGFRYLSDDLAEIWHSSGAWINPAFPMLKMCKNVAENRQMDLGACINEQKDKYAVYDIENYCDEPRELKSVFFLELNEGDSVIVKEYTGVDKLMKFMGGLFLSEIHVILGVPKEEVFRCLKIVEKIRVYSVARPKEGDTLEEVYCEIKKRL